MKDGTPLVDEEEPSFVTMPSESLELTEEDDPGEITVIRRNGPPPPTDQNDDDMSFSDPPDPGQRFVVPTFEPERTPPGRPHVAQYQAPPRQNTLKIVVLTIIGTLLILAIGAAGMWLLSSDRSANSNLNVNTGAPNVNANLNTNLGIDTNFNFNASTNIDTNVNANLKTPTPSPTPKPSPSASATPTSTPTPDDDDTPSNDNTRPRATPTPLPTQRTSPTPLPTNRPVNSGVLNGRAINLATPNYPFSARQVGASGRVEVMVLVDENGNVVSARAVSGHPLLRPAAEAAALQSRIMPARMDNHNVRSSGTLLYNFKNN